MALSTPPDPLINGCSGATPVAVVGGGAGISGYHVIADTSGALNVYTTNSPIVITSGGSALGIAAYQSGTSVGISGNATVLSTSGVSFGVLAAAPPLWRYFHYTGGAISNVQSGAVFLHAVNINTYPMASGSQLEVRDATSGAGGTVIAFITQSTYSGTSFALPPTNLPFDVLLTSGLVLDSSGAAWDATVVWKSLLS